MNLSAVKSLASLYVKSVERSRRVWLVLQIFSVVVFIAVFNHRFSWYRTKILRDDFKIEKMEHEGGDHWKSPLGMSEYVGAAIHKNVEFEGKMKFVGLEWIGSEIYADDLPLIASTALAIILAWFIFAYRRTVGILQKFRDVIQNKEISKGSAELIMASVSFYQIFNDTKYDSAVSSKSNGDDTPPKKPKRSVNEIVTHASLLGLRALIFAPVFIFFGVSILDIWETFCLENAKFKELVCNNCYETTFNIFYNPSKKFAEYMIDAEAFNALKWIKLEIWVRTIFPILMVIFCGFQAYTANSLSIKERKLNEDIEQQFNDSFPDAGVSCEAK
jgi:hypothetical protein